jgi:hypothetical protein
LIIELINSLRSGIVEDEFTARLHAAEGTFLGSELTVEDEVGSASPLEGATLVVVSETKT